MDRIDSKLQQAVVHHQAGRVVDALRLYRQVLAEQPNEPDALHLLGLLLAQSGNTPEAVESIQKAIEHRPHIEDFHLSLARVLRNDRQLKKSTEQYQIALDLNPVPTPAVLREAAETFIAAQQQSLAVAPLEKLVKISPSADNLALLGDLQLSTGAIESAISNLARAVEMSPADATFRAALGFAQQKHGDFELARGNLQQAIALNPSLLEAKNNLAFLLIQQRQLQPALELLRDVIRQRPHYPQAQLNLALVYTGMAKTDDALRCYRTALEQQPRFPQAWEGLGRVLMDLREYPAAVTAFSRLTELTPTAAGFLLLSNACGALEDLDPSINAARRAVEISPESAIAHETLGAELQYVGDRDHAYIEFETALRILPTLHTAHSKWVYALLLDDRPTPAEILQAHQQWARQQTAHIVPLRRPRNQPSPDRPLRIGFISPNFRQQAVATFVLPIFRNHSRDQFHFRAYSDVAVPDSRTVEFQQSADSWLDISGLTDEALARQIREDRIDVLIELTGHIGGGRLRALAYKPAPVQVSYIGYQGTTGVPAVDYVITDAIADPPGNEQHYVETPWRLPESFFCYDPPAQAPLINPLPALRVGCITFGCLNAINKVTPTTVSLWATILTAVPQSRLMLMTTRCQSSIQNLLERFTAAGVAHERIELVDRVSTPDYFRRYQRIDIALDPVPFNGHTTTCDAAWMGVPTITLAGKIYAHRYGSSVLQNLGLNECIAQSAEDYASKAIALASNLPQLATIRQSLRQRMQRSIITNGPAFTLQFETALREMWHRWATAQRLPQPDTHTAASPH